jgi:hypothetical protein
MTLSDHQWEFLKDVAKLIQFAEQQGIKLTGGELDRTIDQQRIYYSQGKSKTMNSNHLRRLAIDLNVFKDIDKDGDKDYTTRYKHVKVLGDYWELLHPRNRWGGDWNGNDINDEKFIDTPHFERNI